MKTKFVIDRTHPGPFITVTREYDQSALEIRIHRSDLIFPEGIKGGVMASKATDEQLLPYAKMLLMSALEKY